MSRMDKFVTVVAAGVMLCELAVASLLLLAGTSNAAQAAEGATRVAPGQAAHSPAPTLFDSLDTNRDQVLTRREFQAGYAGLQRVIAMQVRLREQFGVLDVNRSGAIDASEYANLELIRSHGKTAPSLGTFDADNDQKLNFAEYAVLVRRLAPAQGPAKK
jgi:hypothetical protein